MLINIVSQGWEKVLSGRQRRRKYDGLADGQGHPISMQAAECRAARVRWLAGPGRHDRCDYFGPSFLTRRRMSTQMSATITINTKSQKKGFFV